MSDPPVPLGTDPPSPGAVAGTPPRPSPSPGRKPFSVAPAPDAGDTTKEDGAGEAMLAACAMTDEAS